MVPGIEKGIDDEEAPLEVSRRMNEMVKSLINKCPSVKFGPWIGPYSKSYLLLTKFPEDVDTVEKYVYVFNRFVSPEERGYVRLNGYLSSKTSVGEIESIISSFKKPRIQFFQLVHSDATAPVNMGILTGSVKEIDYSPDFMNTFKKKLWLNHLGLWWTQPRSEGTGDFSPKKFMVHYKLDRQDINKNFDILKFVNQNSSSIDNHFFGTAMSIIPPFTPFLENEVKVKITSHVRKKKYGEEYTKYSFYRC